MTKQKLLMVAVACALAAPATALAQLARLEGEAKTGGVQIYGRANLGLDNYAATGATAGAAADYKARSRVYDASSRIGFRGKEDLGQGLLASFLIESGANLDTGSTIGQNGLANSGTGVLASRLGYVGLENRAWGALTFGRFNVWWANGVIEQTGANYVNTGMPQVSGGLGRGMAVGVSRVNNLIQYTTPEMGGVTALFSYSPNGEAAAAGANADGKLWGLTLTGAFGPVVVGYDWVNNAANKAIAAPPPPQPPGDRSTTAHKLRAGWFYQPGANISVIWVKSVQQNGGAGGPAAGGVSPDFAATELSQTGLALSWAHTFGKIHALAQLGRVYDITGCVTANACANTNATSMLLGARYLFSRRTAVYVTYNATRNASNYNMDYVAGSITSAASAGAGALSGGLPATSVGADPRIIAFGIQHIF